MYSARDILAVCFGFQQKFSKVSLHLENFCCKPKQTAQNPRMGQIYNTCSSKCLLFMLAIWVEFVFFGERDVLS